MLKRLAAMALPLMLNAPALADDVCPTRPPAPAVVMDVDMGQVKMSLNRSREQIAAMASSNRNAVGSHHRWRPVGLTVTELRYSMSTKVMVHSRGGRHCANLTEVTFKIGYDDLDVFVARNYRPGTCEHRAINAHEHEHVQVFRSSLATYAPKIQDRLERIARGMKPIRVGSPKVAAQRFQDRIYYAIKPFLDGMQERQAKLNAALDTEENYRREQARCSDW